MRDGHGGRPAGSPGTGRYRGPARTAVRRPWRALRPLEVGCRVGATLHLPCTYPTLQGRSYPVVLPCTYPIHAAHRRRGGGTRTQGRCGTVSTLRASPWAGPCIGAMPVAGAESVGSRVQGRSYPVPTLHFRVGATLHPRRAGQAAGLGGFHGTPRLPTLYLPYTPGAEQVQGSPFGLGRFSCPRVSGTG